ncbi:MAG: family 20 glycosylhydrolase [Pyrinomonadaceae bacterium]
MKTTLFAAAFCLLLASFSFAQTDEINIIPRPKSITPFQGEFVVSNKTKLLLESNGDKKFAILLNAYLKNNVGFTLSTTNNFRCQDCIAFTERIIDPPPFPEGGYRLSVRQSKLVVQSTNDAGKFNGLQSLIQLMTKEPKGNLKVRSVSIYDYPRFPYRGMHLDVSRHFMPVEFVKKYIDLMSQYKFNTFHWHLTDDQGWRIEVKKYPRLTEIGSKRTESHLGPYTTTFKGDGVPVEGFYTQDQIREVVAYAKARYITVIPEIELPGHASAALAAYPQFGCKAGYDYKVKMTWGIFTEVFCPTDETFKFLEDVLDETIKLFPDSPYIHIGGDEVLKTMWKESPFVQELKKKEGLKDEHEVQSYFVRRIEKFINSKGKKIIGWDEILEGGLAPNATVMSWRGTKGGIEAAKAKHDVIMTPTDYSYFDYNQGDPATEPLNIGGYVTLEKVYSFDPVPKELSPAEAKYIIGGQANIWTEYLETPAAVEYMAFPRMLAMSEVLWSQPSNKDYEDFLRRLPSSLIRLDKQNVNFRIPEPHNLQNVVLGSTEGFKIENIYSDIPGARVLHTTDGSEPNEKSPQIPAKFLISPNGDKVQTLKTIVVLPSGRKSSVYSVVFLRRLWLGPQPDPKDSRPGVKYSLYVPSNAYGQDTVPVTGETKSIGLEQFANRIDPKQTWGVSFDGYFNAPVDAIYEFQIDSTNDRQLTIDEQTLIDEAGTKDRAVTSTVVPLRAGWHKISMHYDHREGDPFWRVRWAIKGQNWRGLELVH